MDLKTPKKLEFCWAWQNRETKSVIQSGCRLLKFSSFPLVFSKSICLSWHPLMLVAKRKKFCHPQMIQNFIDWAFQILPKSKGSWKGGKSDAPPVEKRSAQSFAQKCSSSLFSCFHVPVKVVAAMNQRHPRFNITKLYNCVPQIPIAIYFWWQRLVGKHLDEKAEDSLQT